VESMKFTSLLEEVHFKMIRRLLFTSIVATQFLAFSAVVRDDAFRGSDLSAGNGRGSLTPVLRAEDPVPCPECDPPDGPPGLSVLRAEDPVPCPECDPPNAPPPPDNVRVSSMLAEDPVPCPEYDPPDGPPLTLVLL
jgi:hypothetical protein